jgi:hypothetical protein
MSLWEWKDRKPGEEDGQGDGAKGKKTVNSHYAAEAFRTSCAGLVCCGKEELYEKLDSIIEQMSFEVSYSYKKSPDRRPSKKIKYPQNRKGVSVY